MDDLGGRPTPGLGLRFLTHSHVDHVVREVQISARSPDRVPLYPMISANTRVLLRKGLIWICRTSCTVKKNYYQYLERLQIETLYNYSSTCPVCQAPPTPTKPVLHKVGRFQSLGHLRWSLWPPTSPGARRLWQQRPPHEIGHRGANFAHPGAVDTGRAGGWSL